MGVGLGGWGVKTGMIFMEDGTKPFPDGPSAQSDRLWSFPEFWAAITTAAAAAAAAASTVSGREEEEEEEEELKCGCCHQAAGSTRKPNPGTSLVPSYHSSPDSAATSVILLEY